MCWLLGNSGAKSEERRVKSTRACMVWVSFLDSCVGGDGGGRWATIINVYCTFSVKGSREWLSRMLLSQLWLDFEMDAVRPGRHYCCIFHCSSPELACRYGEGRTSMQDPDEKAPDILFLPRYALADMSSVIQCI